jgi:hypothetical protein
MLSFDINKHHDLCEDDQCEHNQLRIWIEYDTVNSEIADIVIEHQEPLTPWKYNNNELIRLDKESTLKLIDTLLVLYARMP